MKNYGLISAFKLLWNISNKKEKIIFILLCFSMLIRSITELIIPLITACVISKLSGEQAKILWIILPDSLSLFELIFICFSIFFSLSIISTIIRALVKLFATYMSNKTNTKALSYALEFRKNFNLNMTNGEASYIIKNASENVAVLIETFFIKIFVPIITIIMAISYIISISVISFLITMLSLILICLTIYYRIHNDKKVFKDLEIINGEINNHTLNCIENLPFISFIKSKYLEFKISKKLNNQYYKKEKKRIKTYIIYWTLIYSIEFACIIFVCLQLINQNLTSLQLTNSLIIIIPYLLNIFTSIENMAYLIGSCQQYAIKISRINLLIANPENIILENKELPVIPKDEKFDKIEIKNFHIKIGNFDKYIDNLCFYKNKINCIAGQSGSGKTSLINSILGLKDYQEGKIIINDKYEKDSLFFENQRIALAFQDEKLFDRSFIENISYPENGLNEKTKSLIKYFKLDNLLQRDEMKNKNAFKSSFSGGEKKRITLVQCLSKNADVYVLDEPTNELDFENVNKILSLLNEMKKDCIIIVISHDKRITEISENLIYI